MESQGTDLLMIVPLSYDYWGLMNMFELFVCDLILSIYLCGFAIVGITALSSVYQSVHDLLYDF